MRSAADGGARNTNSFQWGDPRSLIAISTLTREKSAEPRWGSSDAKGSTPAGSVRVINTSPPASSVQARSGLVVVVSTEVVIGLASASSHAVVEGGGRVDDAPSDERSAEPPVHADAISTATTRALPRTAPVLNRT